MERLKAVILAAGKGTRMKSDLPKVIHEIEGRCLADYVIDAAIGAGAREADVCLVVGYKAELVRGAIAHKGVSYALQKEQLGTAHAVMCARDFLGEGGETLVLCGDTPLITAGTLRRLAEWHSERGNAATALSAIVGDASGYGRIIRGADGAFIKNVEDRDATDEERRSREINSGMYVFDTGSLMSALDRIRPDNAQGEYYLPDALSILKGDGLSVDAFAIDDAEEIAGVNDQEQLRAAAAVIRRRAGRSS